LLQRSLSTDVPGLPFSVAVSLMSNADGSPISGVPVDVRLEPGPDAACQESASCTAASAAGYTETCQLALPCVGRFNLTACAVLQGFRVCTSQPLGQNASEWAAEPWTSHVPPRLTLDKCVRQRSALTYLSPKEESAARFRASAL
jgi:hypothetical protein